MYQKWSRLALLNLAIVAAAGVMLRYKIVFSLPVVDHKNLLHAHSHFAFSGWVSLALCMAMVSVIAPADATRLRLYNRLFVAMNLVSFGMLLTFPFMGYKAPSIALSTLSILLSYCFAGFTWKDMDRSALPRYIAHWFKAALFFYVLSSLGAFHLAWLMASKTGSQPLYIGSVYFFLHFQYNGWFLFAIIGLFFAQWRQSGIAVDAKKINNVFWLLAGACVPAFLLSALWMRLPMGLRGIAVTAALVQLAALVVLYRSLGRALRWFYQRLNKATRLLWLLAGIACLLKFFMQGLSAIPQLSYLAFGFRPIVIGYLHLILLGFVTLFLLGYLVQQQFLQYQVLPRWGKAALIVFVGGVILNELLLMTQGIAAIGYTGLPWTNYLLLVAALIMCSGLVFFLWAQCKGAVTIHAPG
jgi:hypothetical protein